LLFILLSIVVPHFQNSFSPDYRFPGALVTSAVPSWETSTLHISQMLGFRLRKLDVTFISQVKFEPTSIWQKMRVLNGRNFRVLAS